MMLKISLLTTRYGFNTSWNACNKFYFEKIQLQPKAIFDRATIFLAEYQHFIFLVVFMSRFILAFQISRSGPLF